MKDKYNKTKVSAGKTSILLTAFILLLTLQKAAFAQQNHMVVHIAKLEIDSAQLDKYKAALKEHAETAVRVDRVCSLYMVFMKKNIRHT